MVIKIPLLFYGNNDKFINQHVRVGETARYLPNKVYYPVWQGMPYVQYGAILSDYIFHTTQGTFE
jgi:hypothetical protein